MCCCTLRRCCCMTLHNAGVVIGWLSTVLSLVLSTVSIVILANLDRIVGFNQVDSRNANILTGITIAISVQLVFCLLDCVASVVMIFGTKKNSHQMLLPWLVQNGIMLVFLVVLEWLILMELISSDYYYRHYLMSFVITAFILVIFSWAWIAILSLFRVIRASYVANNCAHNYEIDNTSYR